MDHEESFNQDRQWTENKIRQWRVSSLNELQFDSLQFNMDRPYEKPFNPVLHPLIGVVAPTLEKYPTILAHMGASVFLQNNNIVRFFVKSLISSMN